MSICIVGHLVLGGMRCRRLLSDVVFAKGTDGSTWLWAFELPNVRTGRCRALLQPSQYRVLATGFEGSDFVVHIS